MSAPLAGPPMAPVVAPARSAHRKREPLPQLEPELGFPLAPRSHRT
eukprot:CAMPEP_0115884212 /NCGR_PEP_ID=MMETSP0287-20121206/29996_1 /TAXON_ID=412157 /ORGANISM="Chrysochromulina rotalis, Strain UIO044" /LENGTH=45 /DNA_ID= /DNA_START= /DNA_END= /DNA_ORIENTATION=